MPVKKWQFDTSSAARAVAKKFNCRGSHQDSSGKWVPCKTPSEFVYGFNKYLKTTTYYTAAPSNFETIDVAFNDWIDDRLNIHVNTNDGFKKVNIVWLTQERVYQVKKTKEDRDHQSEALIFPLISIERTSVAQASAQGRPTPGLLQPNRDAKTPRYLLGRKIVQEKTKNFANATSLRLNSQNNSRTPKNERIVYEYSYAPMPVFYDIKYTINIRTDYQQQMNEIVEAFNREAPGYFMIYNGGHKYEAFLESNYSFNNNLSSLEAEEKIYEATLSVKVLGYVLNKGDNQEDPKILKKQNRVKVRFPRERTIVGDINEFENGSFIE